MKITDVKAYILSYDLKEPFQDATYEIAKRTMVLVKIFTDTTLIGIGEACYYGGPASTTKYIIENELKDYIIGEDPLEIGRLWEKMYSGTIKHGRKGVIIAAISGIDIALWDLKGKILGQPIYKLLGGHKSKVKTYASGGFYTSKDPMQFLIQQVKEYINKGFQAIKIKIGRHGLEDDFKRIKGVKETIGNKIELIVDGNNAYKVYEAIKIGRLLDQLNIKWFEEPLPADDLEGMNELRNKIDTPVSAGENNFTRYGHKYLLSKKAVDIIQPDVNWCGGISEARNIAVMASLYNVLCSPHSFSSAISLVSNLHLNCGIENSNIQEFDQQGFNPLRDQLINEKLDLDKNGKISVPKGPGLGITINEDSFKQLLLN